MMKCLKYSFIFLLATSCGRLTYAPSQVGQINSSITTANQIVLYSNELPKKPFEEIGVLHFDGNGNRKKIEELMKIEAAKQGGNAIIEIKKNSVGFVATVVRIKE